MEKEKFDYYIKTEKFPHGDSNPDRQPLEFRITHSNGTTRLNSVVNSV